MRIETIIWLLLAILFLSIFLAGFVSIRKLQNKMWKEWNKKMDMLENHIEHYSEIISLLEHGKSITEVLDLLNKKEKDSKDE